MPSKATMNNKTPFYNRLHFKVTALFVVIVLVVELIIGIAAINLTKNNFRHAMLNSFQSTITMTENFISLISQMGAGWSNYFKITEEHLIPMIKSPTAELNSNFLHHFKEESTADVVIILNQDGRVILHSANAELEGKSLKGWQIVGQTLSEQKAMVSIVQDLDNLIIYSSEPVFENSYEPPIGAIMVGYVINDQLISGMKKHTLTNVSIIRRRGVMASTYNTPEGRLTNIPMNYMTYQSLLARQHNDYGDTTMLVNDEEYFVYARNLTKMDPSMVGSILLSYPESELQIFITDMLNRFILIGIMSFIIIVMISGYFSKQLLSPLRHLLDKTSRLEKAELLDTLIESDKNEIGALAHRFNILSQSIKKKNIKLNSKKELLKDAVKERTQELEDKNTELENQDINLINAQRIARLGSWEWDHEKNLLSCSPQFYNILGVQNVSQLNHLDDFFTYIHIDDRETVVNKMTREEACKIEFRICRPDGKQRNVIIEMEVSQGGTKSHPVITSTLRDITESKRHEEEQASLQRQLHHSQKMETLGQLTGGIAHDFNNILASIMGYTELSLARLEHYEDKKLGKFLNQIYISSERARDLVAQMEEFSPGRTENIELVKLLPLVKKSLKTLGSILPASMEIQLQCEDDDLSIKTNQVQLYQMIMNLCINSRDAMQDKGILTLRLESKENIKTTCLSCGESISGNYVLLIVDDSGPGIKPEQLTRIFDPYFTTKMMGSANGTGMGLAIVHGIMHGHGGHVTVETEVGEGTRISLLFPEVNEKEHLVDENEDPVDEKEDLENEKNATLEKIYGQNIEATILIVDDEASTASFIAEQLKNYNYEVFIEINSQTAVDNINKNPDQYDLVVTDHSFQGLTGKELSKLFLEIRPDLPIILCSGKTNYFDNDNVKNSGDSGFVKEPIYSNSLLTLVKQQLLNK